MGLSAFTAGGTGSIPGGGTKILQAAQRGQKIIIIFKMINKYLFNE